MKTKTKILKLKQLTQSISLVLLASSTAQSAEFIVTTTGDSGGGAPVEVSPGVFEIDTLRSAIQQADNENTFPGADNIRFIDSLFNNNQETINLNNVGDTFVNSGSSSNSALGINSEISIQGPTDAELIMLPNNMRHFQVNSGGQLKLSKVTLDGGIAPDNSAGFGGAILVREGGALNLYDSDVTNNVASSGGGIYLDEGSLESTIDRSLFNGNSSNGFFGFGGAIAHRSDGTLSIRQSTFTNNTSSYDGGAIFTDGDIGIQSSTIANNSTYNHGGGIRIINEGTLRLANSSVSNNHAQRNGGGGISRASNSSEPYSLIINSTITQNQAKSNDQANEFNKINLGFDNHRGYLNFDSKGGGIYVYSVGSFLIHNTIISDNTAFIEQIPDDVTAALINNSSHNLFGVADSLIGLSDGVNGNQIGSLEAPIDAGLQPLADNGGSTLTQLPNPTSPAIDAGNDVFCSPMDQRNFIRPIDGDGNGSATCDIGAVEFGSLEDLIFTDDFDD